MLAANYLYSEAEPDGLILGLWNSFTLFPAALADDPSSQGVIFDGRKFGWVGAASDSNPVCAIMGHAGVTDADEILAPNARYQYGATALTGSTLVDIPRITNEFVDTDHQIISGYSGTASMRQGLQNGEIDAACWDWESMKVTARSMLDARGSAKLIPYVKVFPNDDPEIADLPLLGDFITNPADKALYDLWTTAYRFQRPVTTPPGMSEELLEILQVAFADTMADPDFTREALNSGLYLNPQSGDDIQRWVDQMLGMSTAQRSALQFLLSEN